MISARNETNWSGRPVSDHWKFPEGGDHGVAIRSDVYEALTDEVDNFFGRPSIVQAAMMAGIYGIEVCDKHVNLDNRDKPYLWPDVSK